MLRRNIKLRLARLMDQFARKATVRRYARKRVAEAVREAAIDRRCRPRWTSINFACR